MDDDSKPTPLVFAHRVIEMLAGNLVGESKKLNREGYRLIRVVFRRLGGSWRALCSGDPQHVDLLIEVVKAWGERESTGDQRS